MAVTAPRVAVPLPNRVAVPPALVIARVAQPLLNQVAAPPKLRQRIAQHLRPGAARKPQGPAPVPVTPRQAATEPVKLLVAMQQIAPRPAATARTRAKPRATAVADS